MDDAVEAFLQTCASQQVLGGGLDGGTGKMGVMGDTDNTQTTCLHSHAGSSLLFFHIHVFTRATQHI